MTKALGTSGLRVVSEEISIIVIFLVIFIYIFLRQLAVLKEEKEKKKTLRIFGVNLVDVCQTPHFRTYKESH